jgi:raffinose/stachyose/melibiose transport system substrate-binding protein
MTSNGSGRLRRLGLLAAVPVIGALTLAGCGGGGTGGGTGGTAGGFSFTFPVVGTQESPYETLAKKYSQEKGVNIEFRKLPNDAYGLTLRTQLQGGSAPDLMVVSPGRGQDNSVLPLADAKYLQPLNEKSAAVVPKGSENLFGIGGQTYAQPTDLVPVGMTWNSGAASQAGVTFPETFDQVRNLCATLTQQGKSFIALAGSVPPNPGLMSLSISATRVYADTPDWNKQRADGKVTFADSRGWQDTLQTIVDMNGAGCFQPGAAGGGFDAITAGITQGTSLGAFVPGGAAQELMTANPGLKLEIRPFPPASGKKPFLLASPNYGISINAKAGDAQKRAAQEFLNWLAEPANAAQFTKIEGMVPIAGVQTAELLPQYAPVKDLLVKGEYAPLPTLDWPNPGVYDALAKGVQGLIAGQGDISSVLQAADRAWAR